MPHDLLPDGDYTARAVSAQIGEAGNGTRQVAILFRLLDPELHGRKILYRGYFTDKTAERTIESMRICGWEGTDFENLGGITRNDVSLSIGREKSQNGKVYNRVKFVNALSKPKMAKTLSSDELRKFSAEMRVYTAVKKEEPGQQKLDLDNTVPTNDDDQIPF